LHVENSFIHFIASLKKGSLPCRKETSGAGI